MSVFSFCTKTVLLFAIGTGVFFRFGFQYAEDAVPAIAGLIPLFHQHKPRAFTESDIPNLSGKTHLVTGANVGLGYWTAYHIAKNNGRVILACRNARKCAAAKSQILEEIPNAQVDELSLDLGDLQSVKTAAEAVLSTYERLDSLILNAGVCLLPYGLAKSGLETQMAVNHVGHFYFTDLLLPLLKKSGPSTIAVVSSVGHFQPDTVPTTVATINDEKNYSPELWYNYSKLANVLYAQELASRLENEQVFVNSVHPGAVATELVRYALKDIEDKWYFKYGIKHIYNIYKLLVWQPREAALTQLYIAVSPDVVNKNIRGKYFHPIGYENPTNVAAKDLKLQKDLWKFTDDYINKQMGQ